MFIYRLNQVLLEYWPINEVVYLALGLYDYS